MFNKYKKFFKSQEDYFEKYVEYSEDIETFIAFYEGKGIMLCGNPEFIDKKFKEAVIDINPELIILKNKIKELFSNIWLKVDLDELLNKLNKLLKNRKIIFRYSPKISNKYIEAGGYNSGDDIIFLFVTFKIFKILDDKEDYDIVLDEIITLLGRELIHRGQAIKIKDIETIKRVLKKSPEERKKYYSQKTEIMSYAWQITNEFRLFGKKDMDIRIILQSDSFIKYKFSDILKDYHKYFTMNDWQLKLLYKYMYIYLDK